jgi:hypothetical protein
MEISSNFTNFIPHTSIASMMLIALTRGLRRQFDAAARARGLHRGSAYRSRALLFYRLRFQQFSSGIEAGLVSVPTEAALHRDRPILL